MSEAPIKSIPARFGAFNDRRVSEELEGFVPGSMNLCKAAIAGAELPELWPRAWDRAGDIVPAAYGLRIAWRLLKKAYARHERHPAAPYDFRAAARRLGG